MIDGETTRGDTFLSKKENNLNVLFVISSAALRFIPTGKVLLFRWCFMLQL
jgi:hypothetical protein